MMDQRFDQRRFAAVYAQVARIEHPLAVSFDEQRIGVETGVISEEGGNPERPEIERDLVRKGLDVRRAWCVPEKRRGRPQ
jgi:hypothetical protein